MIRVDECAWNAISSACHTVTLQPHATFRTFSLGRKEKSEEKKFLLSNHSGPCWSTKHVPTWVLPLLCPLYWTFSSVPVQVPITMAGKALSDHVKRQRQHKLKKMHVKMSGNISRLGMITQFQPGKQSVRDWKWLELDPKTYWQSQRDLWSQSQ